MGCICQAVGRVSWYVTRLICFTIVKGLYLLGASLVDWYGSLRWDPSNHTWSPMVNCDDGASPAF